MDLAIRYGADTAIFLHNLVFWVEKNRANGKHFHDGRYWTYNTMEAFAELYPLWSRDQIKRLIAKCRENGLLLVGEYNRDKRDRTKWYSPSDEILALYGIGAGDCKGRNRQMHSAESPQTEGDIATALPEGLPEGLQDPPTNPPQGERTANGDNTEMQDKLFARFWEAYPPRQGKRAGKKAARKAWDKLRPDLDLCRRMAAALDRDRRSPQWLEENGRYIPMASTWLNNRAWEDEYIGPAGTPPPAEGPRRVAADPEVPVW